MAKAISYPHKHFWVVPARILASIIDYLVVSAFASLCARLGLPFDTLFVATFFIGMIYFGFGNGSLSGGQTLGKRAFGIRVSGIENPVSFWKAALRYTLSIGIIILIVELPQLYFRKAGTVASLLILESPMLLALNLLALQFAFMTTSNGALGLHDIILHTGVTRKGGLIIARLSRATLGCSLAFITIVSILWFGQIQLPPSARSIYEHRFRIERDMPLRILQVVEEEPEVRLYTLALPDTPDYERAADRLAQDLWRTLMKAGDISLDLQKKYLIVFQFQHGGVTKERMLYPESKSQVQDTLDTLANGASNAG